MDLEQIFKSQQSKTRLIAGSSSKERKAKLKRLERSILQHRDAICEGMWKDFQKPATEVDFTEIYPVLLEIRFAVKNLSEWMKDDHVPTPITLLGATSKIKYDAKGTSLIISPWNYPFQLLLAPLVSAIAAGCTAILKPSEYTPHTSVVVNRIIADCFEADEAVMVEGDVDVSTELLQFNFDHIFFTGAPEIGKVVMTAAAKNLSSVTLELGGKSPTIIDETANLDAVVPRIVWAKFINAGQTCIAPDYILIHESQKEAFVRKMSDQIEKNYGKHPEDSQSYAHIINEKHFNRLSNYLDEAVTNGAVILYGGVTKQDEKVISPTLIDQVSMDGQMMQNEIFGPILPLITYRKKEEVIDFIESKEKPLALYVYSKSRKNIDYFLKNTASGGVGINISALHIGNSNLPFGGVNNSGIGKSRGHFGFLEFSNQRAILDQRIFSSIEFLAPPYTNSKQKIMRFLMKYF
ncbi:MAG TPA: aldehyde dehydrogenase family protein [Flavobacteriales bacterium]|jgi:aldehyde dehydrogenase (NAD+)|nr:aldehyde dehydrogenase family protein [Flavobacteriales bacterium]